MNSSNPSGATSLTGSTQTHGRTKGTPGQGSVPPSDPTKHHLHKEDKMGFAAKPGQVRSCDPANRSPTAPRSPSRGEVSALPLQTTTGLCPEVLGVLEGGF